MQIIILIILRIKLTFGYTTNPSLIFCKVFSMASAVRKASARLILLFALSSKDLSSHCTAAVCCASATSIIKWRAKLQHLLETKLFYRLWQKMDRISHLSLLIGFLL